MKRVIIFASGAGSNAENIIRYFQNSKKISVQKVFCNKKEAGVFNRCKKLAIDCEWFSREDFSHSNTILEILTNQTDFIVLAGFLWKIPEKIVTAFPNKIINIHPALLPKYGGKGMYGMHVHNAVKNSGDLETGITIHFVNERYDEGAVIFQAKTQLKVSDSPEDIAQKIHSLEYEYFPKLIEKTILKDGN
jgi:phosphoribosylglycinamide formyltransferase-1